METPSDRTPVSDNLRLGCALESFADKEAAIGIINELKLAEFNRSFSEIHYEKFLMIFDKYQEQPHLLDSGLDQLLSLLIDIIRNHANFSEEVIIQAFKYLYCITKVRGHKTVVKHFPHEVDDLEPVLSFLSLQDPNDPQKWEIRYILLLWLSIIVLIPFNMACYDNDLKKQNKTMIDRLLDVTKVYLCVSDKCQDGAANLVSKLLTRPDILDPHLPQFIDWCLQKIILNKESSMFSQIGTLSALAQLFKHSKREDIKQYSNSVLEVITKANLHQSKVVNVRKLAFKLIQRIGMTYLSVKIASWRYNRGARSLIMNLTTAENFNANSIGNNFDEKSEDMESEEIPDEVETVIELLIKGLKDENTIVRWSAAKGVGRITGKLSREYADEIIEFILMLFSLRETDSSWHGGCLALAELGRRGLLLPNRLPEVVPVILKALFYDEQHGTYSVGTHIRDAACYVCWSFARAYEPKDIKPFVEKISSSLLIVSVFDREVNCRRAASAAFQENVGRLGTFPHGIEILSVVDYFAVGNRNACYLKLCKYIAQFEEYKNPLIEHLLDLKVNHWDKEVRELAASALGILAPESFDLIINKVMPKLIELSVGFDLYTRHGAIISVGHIIHSITKHRADPSKSLSDILGKDIASKIKALPKSLNEKKFFRGIGGELMRLAVNTLIELLSDSFFPTDNDDKGFWLNLLEDNLITPNVEVQNSTLSSLDKFLPYYIEENIDAGNKLKSELVHRYLEHFRNGEPSIQVGFCRAIGVMPKSMLLTDFQVVISNLRDCCLSSTNVDLRQYSMESIYKVCERIDAVDLNKADINSIFSCFLYGLNDYTNDSRGDTGSWVRRESMNGLKVFSELILKRDPKMISSDVSEAIFIGLAKQAVENIDKIRTLAGSIFSSLLHSDPCIPNIPYYNDLMQLFPKYECLNTIGWSNPADTFGRFSKLMNYEKFSYDVTVGMIVSVGGLTEFLVKISSDIFISHVQLLTEDEFKLKSFCDLLLKIFKENKNKNRIIMPLFNALDQVLSTELITPENVGENFFVELVDHCKKEMQGCSDPAKLISSIDLFCALVQYECCRRKVLVHLAILMCHRYPRVRLEVVGKLYDTLISFDFLSDNENFEEIMSVLGDTDWNRPVDELRPLRDKLCDLLGVPAPIRRKK